MDITWNVVVLSILMKFGDVNEVEDELYAREDCLGYGVAWDSWTEVELG
jgi:hypothetical protein